MCAINTQAMNVYAHTVDGERQGLAIGNFHLSLLGRA